MVLSFPFASSRSLSTHVLLRRLLVLESEGEANDLRIVFATLAERNGEIDRDRHLPEERQGQAHSSPDTGSNCTDSHVRLNRAEIGEHHPAQALGINRKAD